MADDLLQNYAEDIASVALVPGHKGVFKVYLNDELKFGKTQLGRYPDPSEVVEALFAAIDGQ